MGKIKHGACGFRWKRILVQYKVIEIKSIPAIFMDSQSGWTVQIEFNSSVITDELKRMHPVIKIFE